MPDGGGAERVTFGGLGLGLKSAGTLEGLLELPAGPDRPKGGLVLAHPHPLFGGTMRQPVIHHVAKAAREQGFATLRFNFRGVGRSRGSFDGVAEQDDVRAAAAFLRSRLGVESPLVLGGFSFGSMMTALAVASGEAASALVLIALVVNWEEFSPDMLSGLESFAGPILAISGEHDELAPPESVRAFLEGLGLDFELEVVLGAGHLFEGDVDRVAARVAAFLERLVR